MAVYTEVPFAVAAQLMRTLGLGGLTSLTPCAGGIENTNYFADTDASGGKGTGSGTGAGSGRYVLTLFERLTADELPFYLELMRHLAHRGIPVPAPHADAAGGVLHTVLGKPAAVVDRLAGEQRLAPTDTETAQVGATLARMHLAARDFPLHQPNLRGLPWWQQTVPSLTPHLAPEQQALLHSELAAAQALAADPAYGRLPAGPIHADLFRDNVLFDGDRLSGLFDFYFAGVDRWLFDIAVCLNDWCTDPSSGALDGADAAGFVAAYDAVRPLTADETALLPAVLRTAALRFWISRLWDWHLPRDAAVLTAHDPGHFERVLRCRTATPWAPPQRSATTA